MNAPLMLNAGLGVWIAGSGVITEFFVPGRFSIRYPKPRAIIFISSGLAS